MIQRKLSKYIIILLCLLSYNIYAQNSTEQAIEKLLSQSVYKHTNVSIAAFDIETKKQIVDIRSDKMLVPASSMKIITTLVAIDRLGSDFRFNTEISYDGIIGPDGTLKGNLYIVGSGDPTLGSKRMEGNPNMDEVLRIIRDAIIDYGITCIEGDIVADESVFDSFPISPSWQWNDLGNYYAGGSWGLNINENEYYIYLHKRGKVGTRPAVKFFSPHIPRLDLSNEITVDSSNTGDNAYIFGGPYNYYKRLTGTIPAGEGTFTIKGSIPDPPLFLAYHVREKLEKANIQSQSYTSTFKKNRKKRTSIHMLQSPALQDIVKLTNMKSINLYAESILKTIAGKAKMRASGGAGIAVIKKALKKQGVPITGLHMEDGSGLSARNAVSSKVFASTVMAYSNKMGVEKVCSLLPRGGREGTVVNMFKGSGMEGKVWLKSGSMDRVFSYTGILKNKEGRWTSFSVIINGFSKKHRTMRPKLEQIIKKIYLHRS